MVIPLMRPFGRLNRWFCAFLPIVLILVKIRTSLQRFSLFQHERLGIYEGEESIESSFEDRLEY